VLVSLSYKLVFMKKRNQYGLQQPSVQFAVPGMPGQAVQGQGGQKKPVRGYACQQMGHYANRCPARAASGANTTAIVRQ
jgi:hypothetical protein